MESQVNSAGGAIGPGNPPSAAVPLSGQSGADQIVWDQPQPGGSNKALFAVAGAALLIAAGGMVKSMISPTRAAATPVAAAPSYFSEQSRMMKEAMNMAREAQQMQRERMEMMRQEMQMHEEGYAGSLENEAGVEDGGER